MSITAHCSAPVLVVLLTLNCPGSPLFPGISVASSPNGTFIITSEVTLGRDLGGGAHEIENEIFHVHQRITINHERDAFRTSTSFWGTRWSFAIDRKSNAWAMTGNFPLVTDDGEAVVLVNIAPAMSSTMEVFRIYRRTGTIGRLVRIVHLNQLWTQQALSSIPTNTAFTDRSPQWFAGGAFDFSSDSQQLIHTTRWGNTVAIRLTSD